MTEPEADAAARLLERLLTDPALPRGRSGATLSRPAREAGVESVAEEMALGGAGKAMDTLDVRESRSSLAGVFMAAALEGVGVYDFSSDLVPHLEGIPDQVEQVLSRVDLPAVPAGPRLEAAHADTPSYGSSPRPPSAGEFKAITPDAAVAARPTAPRASIRRSRRGGTGARREARAAPQQARDARRQRHRRREGREGSTRASLSVLTAISARPPHQRLGDEPRTTTS